MQEEPFDISQLFEEKQETLQLDWLIAKNSRRVLTLQHAGDYGSELIGHFNPVHPERLHVIGIPEIQWISSTPSDLCERLLDDMLQNESLGFFIADGLPVPSLILEACEKSHTPLFTTQLNGTYLIEKLRRFLARRMAEVVHEHGVLMDVFGLGVLITGASGVGKSELALELLSRGHGLVADDSVELARVAPNVLDGRCPLVLRDFLEVRGLGLLNIRTIFGENACRRKIRLQIVIELKKPEVGEGAERLPIDAQTQEILTIPVRKVMLPVAAGRNLAVLLEAAVRNYILLLRGIDSTREFMLRQQDAMQGNS